MAEVVMKKVKRTQLATFMNTTPKTETPTWSRFGKGVTGQTINYNPVTEEEQYISDDSGSTDVTGYKPTIPTAHTAYSGEPVFEYVDDLRISRAVSSDAITEILLVYLYKTPTGDKYVAEKQTASIQVDDFGGDAGASPILNYTINFIGDAVKGTFDPTKKEFLADGVVASLNIGV